MRKLGVFYTGDLIERDESRMCLFCNQGTVKSPHECPDCKGEMHRGYQTGQGVSFYGGEPGWRWYCNNERCGGTLLVLADEDPDPIALCDNEDCGHAFEDEAEVKEYSTETSVYGDPTGEGGGSVCTSGWADPDWSFWQVDEDKPDEPTDVMDEDDAEEYSPAQWLARTITNRLGSVNPYDGGSTIYAADAREHHSEGKSISLAAHPEGFTSDEINEASRLMSAQEATA